MSVLHPSTFEHLTPTETQQELLAEARKATADYAEQLDKLLPSGPDKTYTLRKLREVAMWVNTSITRDSDGGPRAH